MWWPWTKKGLKSVSAPVLLSNTLSKKKEVFTALSSKPVTLYSCGPTVYSRAHIGNMRAYIFSDTLARVLVEAGYPLRRVINITDVGHLVGDGDQGEDKMQVGASREQLSPEAIAERYTTLFLEDIRALGIDTEHILFPHATDYIKEQLAIIKTLESKGLAYPASDGIYFDTKAFPQYGALGGVQDVEQLAGARVLQVAGKKNPTDFVLWRFAKQGDLQQWGSPWGRGNPGWHIECSAMAKALLGTPVDIHTGGIDHIGTHHNNEIAQSEGAGARPFVRYWMHGAFLSIDKEKISKSLGNDMYVPDIEAKGYAPLSLRYLFLQAHYSSPLSFSWDALGAANEALARLWRLARSLKEDAKGITADSEERGAFIAFIRDDLKTPQALALVWEALKSEDLSAPQKWALLLTADAHLGLSLESPPQVLLLGTSDLPEDIQKLVYERDLARAAGNFTESDRIRASLIARGYRVDDSVSGTLLTRDPQ